MAVDEQRLRRSLHDRLEAALGADEAALLMEYLPPVGWADIARKQDLDALRADVRAESVARKQDLDALRADVRAEIAELKASLLMWLVPTVIGFAWPKARRPSAGIATVEATPTAAERSRNCLRVSFDLGLSMGNSFLFTPHLIIRCYHMECSRQAAQLVGWQFPLIGRPRLRREEALTWERVWDTKR